MAYSFKQRAILAIVPRILAGTIRAIGATLRYDDILAPKAVIGDIAAPSIYAFWHQTLLVSACRFRGLDIAILISRSFDGELIARTVEHLGFKAIRGSSTRGGATALKQMSEAYREGRRCAFTADGPKGPAMVAKPGPVQLAELVGVDQVGAFHMLPDRAWTLKTWDGFLIPKPFSRVRIGWPALTGATLPELQTALDESVRLAKSALQNRAR